MYRYLLIAMVILLTGCGTNGLGFKATVLEVVGDSYLVEPIEGSDELKSADRIMVPIKNVNPSIEPEVGDIIKIKYKGGILESYPGQILDVLEIKVVKEYKPEKISESEETVAMIPMVMVDGKLYLDTGFDASGEERCGMMDGTIDSTVSGSEKPTKNNQSNFGTGYSYQTGGTLGTIEVLIDDNWRIFATEEIRKELQFPEPIDDEVIVYNGKEYKTAELCNQTLHWLSLSEEERMFSSYMPPEFMEFIDLWGVDLEAKDITKTGMTIHCTQSGGEFEGELQTGSWFIVENWTKEHGWREVEYIPRDTEIAWTAEGWIIPLEDTTEWDVDWSWLYGELPSGKYRIGKEIMNFIEPGQFETSIYFAEFEVN